MIPRATMSGIDFNQLLQPETLESFKHGFQYKKPLHLTGDPDRFHDMMNWSILNGLLNQTGLWTSTNLKLAADGRLLEATEYCYPITGREQAEILQPDGERVMALIQDGASLIADSIESLNPGISTLSDSMENILNAKVQCNLYSSVSQRRALDSHYDTHDVYVLHCEGEKQWRIYDGRIDNPVNHPAFKQVSKVDHHRMRGSVMMDITLKPGDFLYLPRGQYHDALASIKSSLHITFGVTHPVGLDVMQLLASMAVAHPFFRSETPSIDDSDSAQEAYAQDFARHLSELALSPEFQADFSQFRREFFYKRGGFDLPVTRKNKYYGKSAEGIRIAHKTSGLELQWPGGVAAIPPGKDKPMRWMIEQNSFSRSQCLDAFPNLQMQDLDGLINDLVRMGVLAEQ